jgi:hypothetical protein
MNPIDFIGSNCNMGRPENLTAQECGDLRVRAAMTLRGPVYTSCWAPSIEDVKNLENGKAIIVQMQLNATVFACIDTFIEDRAPMYAFNRVIVWMPSADQLKAIQEGGNIYISFLTDRFPVMSVYVNNQ